MRRNVKIALLLSCAWMFAFVYYYHTSRDTKVKISFANSWSWATWNFVSAWNDNRDARRTPALGVRPISHSRFVRRSFRCPHIFIPWRAGEESRFLWERSTNEISTARKRRLSSRETFEFLNDSSSAPQTCALIESFSPSSFRTCIADGFRRLLIPRSVPVESDKRTKKKKESTTFIREIKLIMRMSRNAYRMSLSLNFFRVAIFKSILYLRFSGILVSRIFSMCLNVSCAARARFT